MDRGPEALARLLTDRRVVALVGAGCSTESGIPDYRGPETRRRARNPIQYRAFVDDGAARQRYWARSVLGWPRIERALPNAGHEALADLERSGTLAGIITQNVDGLHQQAGSQRVVELHGALRQVRCLDCGAISARALLQERLVALNPGHTHTDIEPAPDGDAELTDVEGFVVPGCEACGGVLKPHVVFFGENVPRPVVEAAYGLLGEAEALLVVGSSLTVFSGYRFVKRAHERGVPVAIVNLGPTRGDPLATLRVDARAGTVLQQLAHALGG
jgi:NAD-dependent SIR2 family protein deacetylase